MDILNKPSLEDLTKEELLALIRQNWGDPGTAEIAYVIWQRMTTEARRLREQILEQQELVEFDRFMGVINVLDEARKLDEQATSYFFRWVLKETNSGAK
jgi:hypothetical protein